MALPELIEIIPLTQPVRAEITVPGSKSITNRALILAALADGEVTLRGALWSEDTQVMTEALLKLGFEIRVENDPAEFCNRTITVKGRGGKIPNTGTAAQPLELFVGNAGTAARFLAAFVCLGEGVYRLSGVARMHERPQAALFVALRELGYRVESENGNDKLPVRIYGRENSSYQRDIQPISPKYQDALTSQKKPECTVSIEQSSQFASALLLSSKISGWEIEIIGENADESPYVAMTSKLMEAFPKNGGEFQIEPDASSGSYFWGVAWLFERAGFSNQITVYDWPRTESQWQLDAQFRIWVGLGLNVGMKSTISRLNELADSIMTAIVIAPFAGQPILFTELGRLRVQECERVLALKEGLTECGANVIEKGDTLTVYPSKPEELHGAEIKTYNDHRMAMCFAVLGLKVAGIKIINPACVKKTFPNFFQKLAAAPPHGLGAEIWEIKDGQRTQKLSGEDLFAD